MCGVDQRLSALEAIRSISGASLFRGTYHQHRACFAAALGPWQEALASVPSQRPPAAKGAPMARCLLGLYSVRLRSGCPYGVNKPWFSIIRSPPTSFFSIQSGPPRTTKSMQALRSAGLGV